MEDELNKMVDLVKEKARFIVEKLGQEHQLFLLTSSPKSLDITPLGEFNRNTIRTAMLLVLRVTKATGYVLVGEAMATFAKYGKELILGEITPDNIPQDDKKDILIIVYTKKGETPKAIEAIIAEIDGRRKVGEWKESEKLADTAGVFMIKDW